MLCRSLCSPRGRCCWNLALNGVPFELNHLFSDWYVLLRLVSSNVMSCWRQWVRLCLHRVVGSSPIWGSDFSDFPGGAIHSAIHFIYIICLYSENDIKTYFDHLPFVPPGKTQLLPEKQRSPMSYLLCIGSFVSSCSCELLWWEKTWCHFACCLFH